MRLAALIAICALPSLVYTAIWLPDEVGLKVIPGLLTTPLFYGGWAENVISVVGILPLVGGVLGFVMTPRLRLLGFWFAAAYLAYSAVFTWHTMTHDYYQLPLLVIVAIGLGGLGEAAVRWAGHGLLHRSAAWAGLVIAAVLTAVWAPPDLLGRTPWRYPDEDRFVAIGTSLGDGERVISLSANYGYPLMYYAKLIVSPWPTQSDIDFETQRGLPSLSVDVRLRLMIDETQARFFVVTLPARSDPSLIALLQCRYQMAESGPDWQVYDLSSAGSDSADCVPGVSTGP